MRSSAIQPPCPARSELAHTTSLLVEWPQRLSKAFGEHYQVYLGVVIPPRNPAHRSGPAYYYHYDIAAGDWLTGWTSIGQRGRTATS
jgi:hypothetical protein